MYFKVENLAFFKKRLFSPRRGSYAEREMTEGLNGSRSIYHRTLGKGLSK